MQFQPFLHLERAANPILTLCPCVPFESQGRVQPPAVQCAPEHAVPSPIPTAPNVFDIQLIAPVSMTATVTQLPALMATQQYSKGNRDESAEAAHGARTASARSMQRPTHHKIQTCTV